jgi:hypothetical protein
LYSEVSLEEYLKYEKYCPSKEHRSAFNNIVETFDELDLYVRFIRVDLVDTEGPEPVPAPKPTLTSETVERALEDAELMVAHGKPANAVDRVHTALHSYVKQVCSDAGFPTDSLTITAAIKLLRQQHPVFSKDSDRSNRSASIMKSFAAVCDSFESG